MAEFARYPNICIDSFTKIAEFLHTHLGQAAQ